MAKVVVAGDAVVVTSNLKLEEIEKVEKYAPSELVLMGGEEEKEEVFKIGTTSGDGSLCKYGASFGRETRDAEKKAMITLFVDENVDDVKEWFADKYGCAITYLNALEEKLPEVLRKVNAERAKIMEQISIAQ